MAKGEGALAVSTSSPDRFQFSIKKKTAVEGEPSVAEKNCQLSPSALAHFLPDSLNITTYSFVWLS